jgi:hypothetical protein
MGEAVVSYQVAHNIYIPGDNEAKFPPTLFIMGKN